MLQTASKLHIPTIQNNYVHSSTFGKGSHSEKVFIFSRLRCFLVILNLTPWVSEKYVKVPTILNNPTPYFQKLTTTFLLIAFDHRNAQSRGRGLPSFLGSHQEQNRTQIISGVPAFALHPIRKKVTWENVLRVAYTLTAGIATISPAWALKVNEFSLASTECAHGEHMCFRSIRTTLAHAATQKNPRALGSAIRSFHYIWRNRNHSPVSTYFWIFSAHDSQFELPVYHDESALASGTVLVSKEFVTLRGLRSSNVHSLNTGLLDLYKPMTKISFELVQRVNGSFVVTTDTDVLYKIFTTIVDDTEFVDMNEAKIERVTGRNPQEYNFLYCVPSTEIYVSSSTAFFLPFDLTTWLLIVTSGIAFAGSLRLINKFKLLDGLLAALAAFLYQSMGSNICRRHVTAVLWSLCCVILSSLYLCCIEALFIVFIGKTIPSLKEMVDQGYVVSLPDDLDSETMKYMTAAYCEHMMNCNKLFGNHNVTTLFRDVPMESFLSPDFHNYLTDPGVGPVMYMNEHPKIRAMVTWLNSHFNPLGITCLEGKEHTNFPASRRVWGIEGLSYVVLMDGVSTFHECGLLGMLMQMQTELLEAFYGSKLKEAYDQRGNANDSEAKPLRKVVKSAAGFSLENPQGNIVFKLWALALALSVMMLTVEALHDRFRKYVRHLRAKRRWQQVKDIYGRLKRENYRC